MSLIAALESRLAERRAAGLWRERRVVESASGARLTVEGREVLEHRERLSGLSIREALKHF